ncbi:MmgE/PrpD family protein [Paracandidimonas soli]|uniref:2-methylcitrate dehydratase PrpD n=1 Tax=Paracandidimonas soli TaxID=1917182 RepID=A0A4R3VG99_9BURK|nr:MmgE/PrpD family protein [Paracandidimonas soli]TCV03271.1 2-methylcitrate dehydratase PrpD [Paracandidimonas soli]
MENTPQPSGATFRLSEWCANVPAQWSKAELGSASIAFIDTIAVMLAGSSQPAQQDFSEAVLALDGGNGKATVAGRSLAASVPWAAMINGCAAHQLDFDDVLDPSMSHPSAVLVPAILALAQSRANSGKDCLDAYIVGLEVLARLGEAMNLAHYSNGWHATSTLGAMAAAAACSRLLRLDVRRTQMAISLASSMAGGSKCQFGTFAKPMHAGMAAKNGIISAHLSSMGTDAIEEPLEGPWGYIALTCGSEAPGFARVLQKLGKQSAMEEHGVSIKLYPCCNSTHRPIDALLAVLAQHAFAIEDIARIEVHISEIAARNLRYSRPETPAQARFSLEYCLAIALRQRNGPGPADFTPHAVLDTEVQSLLPLMDIRTDPELAMPGSAGEAPHRIHLTVHLKDGRKIDQRMEHPLGHPKNPVGQDTLRRKFDACVKDVLGEDKADSLWRQLSALEQQQDINTLMALL